MSTRRIGALIALVFLLGGCTSGIGTGGELQATHWVLDSYSQGGSLTIVPETFYADAEFSVSRVSGFSGCNQYNAVYREGGRMLLVSMPSVTLMACDQQTMDLEQTYLSLLQGANSFSVRGSPLTVFHGGRRPSLVFDAAPQNPLLGKWQVTGYGTTPGAVHGLLPGTSL